MTEFTRKINLVFVGRTVLITLLLITIYLTSFFQSQYQQAIIFYWTMLGALVLNLFLLVLNRLHARFGLLIIYIHLAFDLLLVNFIVFMTGESETPFTLLYIFIIMYSSLFLRYVGILIMTGLTCLSLLTIKSLHFFAIKPVYDLSQTIKEFTLATAVNLLGFLLVGLLTSFLAERLRVTRLRMEQQTDRLQDLKEYNESILSSLRSGLLTTDNRFEIVKINQMGLSLLGPRVSKLNPLSAMELFKLTDEDKALLQPPYPDSQPIRLEKWLSWTGEAPSFYGISISPLVLRGGLESGYIFIFQDLTDIKKLENEIEVQKKLAAIGNLSAAIAHEIRNPLASMMGSIQVLKNQLQLNPSQNHLMDIILRESHRLDRIISDFLQYASNRKYSPKLFDLVALLHETVLLLKHSPEVREDHVIVFSPQTEVVPLHGDPDHLKQVFWNICTNAVKAMPTGGELAISCQEESASVLIEFKDTGRGMNEDQLQHIFEPFYSGFPKGMGLGMAIAYRIVTDHGGRINVQSALGSGTRFLITFPKYQQP